MTKIHNTCLQMMVRNEVELLPALLKYLSPWAEELVIVDTGSTDGTLKVARSFTPNVFSFELGWSFGEARNFGFDKTSKEWLFYVDADEWPTLPLLSWLSDFVGKRVSTVYDGVFIHRHNLVGGNDIGEMTHEWHPRMFRRRFRFIGARSPHEVLSAPTNRFIRAPESCLLRHYKTVERQERQNRLYATWKE